MFNLDWPQPLAVVFLINQCVFWYFKNGSSFSEVFKVFCILEFEGHLKNIYVVLFSDEVSGFISFFYHRNIQKASPILHG